MYILVETFGYHLLNKQLILIKPHACDGMGIIYLFIFKKTSI